MKHLADDIAAQVLSMGAMRYAGKAVATTHGDAPPIGSAALAALEQTRQAFAADDRMPDHVADALRDLQMAAVVFTMQLATSNGHGDPEILQQLEDKLVATLESKKLPADLPVYLADWNEGYAPDNPMGPKPPCDIKHRKRVELSLPERVVIGGET